MTDFKTQWYVAKFEFFIDVNKIISNVMTQLLGYMRAIIPIAM